MSDDLAIPAGLTRHGRRAATIILNLLKKQDSTYTGGCKAFYSPKQWRARGEDYGTEAELIVVHDGGDLAPYFNYDYECYQMVEQMNAALLEAGLFAESCTSWYTAIYREDA